MTVEAPPTGRCAAHPARPAHDVCPTCSRPRCTVDARDRGERCAVCAGHAKALRPPLVAVAGAAAIATVLCVVGSALGQEYVGAKYFSWLFPALVGIVIAALGLTWTGPLARGPRVAVAVLAAAYSGISALLDFRFTQEPFGPTGRWLPPLVAGVVGGAAAVLLLARGPQTEVRSGTPSR